MYIISITQESEINPEDDKEHIVLTHSVTLDDIMTDIRGLLVSVGFSKELVDEYFDQQDVEADTGELCRHCGAGELSPCSPGCPNTDKYDRTA